jgi:hypothetical protein
MLTKNKTEKSEVWQLPGRFVAYSGTLVFIFIFLFLFRFEMLDRGGDIATMFSVLFRAAFFSGLLTGNLWMSSRLFDLSYERGLLFWSMSIAGCAMVAVFGLFSDIYLVKYLGLLAAVATVLMQQGIDREGLIFELTGAFILFGLSPQLVLKPGLVEFGLLLAIALSSSLLVSFIRVGHQVYVTGKRM